MRVEDGFPRSRDALVAALQEKGIGARASYPVPVYRQKAIGKLAPKPRCRVAENALPRLLELPVHPLVTPEDGGTIVKAVQDVR